MSPRSAIPLIVLLSVFSAFFSTQGCPLHELKALFRFKSTLSDTYEMLESWKGYNCCGWYGVECYETQKERHVSKLDLGHFDLRSIRGEIHSSLFELTHLKYLELSGNHFHGEIPSQLGKLSSLRHLALDKGAYCERYDPNGHYYFDCDIDYIYLTSSHLDWLADLSSLEYLSLVGVTLINKSWGRIIGSLLHLRHLDLGLCSLPGSTIPSDLGTLSYLTYLDLSHSSFSNIPSWMGKLSSLTHLGIYYSNISQSIEDAIRNLTGLEYLDLSHNALTGQIPLSLGYNLGQYGRLSNLYLENNNLEGTIPSSLGLLVNLTYLHLGSNQLRGPIPPSIGNLLALKKLYLYDNQLQRNIPASLGNLESLTDLDLYNNQLNGSLPLSFAHLSSLWELDLSKNNMRGTITEVFFEKHLKLKRLGLTRSGLSVNISSTWIPSFQLETLLLGNCQIGGPIPSWVSTQFSLVTLELSANQHIGNLPSWLWDIEEVHLSNNSLEGSFSPTSGPQVFLDVSMNELSGSLPADIHVHCPMAEVLILGDNKFEGRIPTSIANLIYLFFLDMSSNCLTGNVPVTLGNLTYLQGLYLENNSLKGEIPNEFGRLSQLQSLRIGKNSLQGVLPSSLRSLSSLQVFDVGENNLTGIIPHWIANFSNLHILVMRSNSFRGILPPDIGRMPKLQILDLSSNDFFGTIPHSYFRFPAMQNSSADGRRLLIFNIYGSYSDSIDLIVKGQERHYDYVLSGLASFDLSDNRLSGSLSPEIENLKGLRYLNLSMNNLSGQIPGSFGNLVQLESLDLSSNKLSGRIPFQIGNLSYLAHFNISYNNLSGKIPQQGPPMDTFDESSIIGNPNLWGCPLKRNCSRPVGGASPPPAVGVDKKREEGFEFPWYWMCFGLSVGGGFSGVVMVLLLKLSWRTKCFEMMDSVICMLPKPMWW